MPIVLNRPDIRFNASGSAPFYTCRAWVNFDGTRNVTNTGASTNGQPVFIRASGNISSVVKISTGLFTVNFAIQMPDIFYSLSGSAGFRVTASNPTFITFNRAGDGSEVAPTVTQFIASTYEDSTGNGDCKYTNIQVFR
jgi:hypothetical protein